MRYFLPQMNSQIYHKSERQFNPKWHSFQTIENITKATIFYSILKQHLIKQFD